MPEPAGVARTQAAAHLDELEDKLSLANPRHKRGQHLHVVHTWEEFRNSIGAEPYDLLYYYGHGSGDTNNTDLLFASGATNQRKDVAIADLASELRNAPHHPPLLAYINCCQGDAGGILGAGRQLLNDIPAVVTNRTVAHIDAARAQAMAFWQALLVEGLSPHTAVSGLYGRTGDLDLTLKDTRWMIPVLHSHYRDWTYRAPRAHAIDPYWPVKLDRIRQFGQVSYQTGIMLRENTPPELAYIWYGEPGQGVALFHERLKVELAQMIPNAHLYQVSPHWPDEMGNPGRSFEDMLLEAFAVNTLDDVVDRVRSQTRGESGRRILVYLCHEPVELPGGLINSDTLRLYLDWWDQRIAPQLRQANAFGLLTTSFQAENPARFHKKLSRTIDNLPLNDTVVYILDELERLVKKDISDFVKTHNIPLPRDRRDQLLDEVLVKTEGHYERVLEELEKLLKQPRWFSKNDDSGADDEDDDLAGY